MKENLNQKHGEFVTHLRTVHKLTNYYCHIYGFETNSIKLFAVHEHTQQLLWQDMELIYVARSQEEKDDETFNFNDRECPDLNVSYLKDILKICVSKVCLLCGGYWSKYMKGVRNLDVF